MAHARFLALGLILALSAGGARAQQRSPANEAFVNAAAQSDQYEIQSARLIITQSDNERVRAFAQQMIDHHTQTRQALGRAAAAAGAPPPPETLSGDQQAMLAALQSLTGPDLDRTYVTQQVNAHTSALVTQQGYAANGDSPDLKAAAQAAVPIITHHLEAAKALQSAEPGG